MKNKISGYIFIPFLIFFLVILFIVGMDRWVKIISIISSVLGIIIPFVNLKVLPKRLNNVLFNISLSFVISFIAFTSVTFLDGKNVIASSNTSLLNNEEGKKIIEIVPPSTDSESNYITPDELKKEIQDTGKTFNPNISENDLNRVFIIKNIQKSNFAEKKIALDEYIKEHFDILRSTEVSPNSRELNGNKEYTNLIENANLIDNLTNKNNDTYSEAINLREKAYSKGKTRALAILLARDYKELANEYVKQDVKQEAFNCYIKSLEYYEDSIKLMKKDTPYDIDIYSISYMMGQVFHSIGDLKNMNMDMRVNAYLMSSSYLDYKGHDACFYSSYYSGMVKHKLGILVSNDRSLFLRNAYDKYCDSFKYSPTKLSKINLYKFIVDINKELMLFIESNGQKEGMLSYKEYEQRRDSAQEALIKLESELN